MMCWDGRSVKVIGDGRKYVALAPLGKSFFFAKDRVPVSDGRGTTRVLYARLCLQLCACRIRGSGEGGGVRYD